MSDPTALGIAATSQTSLAYNAQLLAPAATAQDSAVLGSPNVVEAGYFTAPDVLASRTPDEVAAWYGRLADAVAANNPGSLAARMLKHWLGATAITFVFDATEISNEPFVIAHLRDEVRRVFLTEKKTSKHQWGGLIPRIQGKPGFTKWDGSSPITMHYEGESLEMPLIVQTKALLGTASSKEIDLFMSLHAFGIKTDVIVSLSLVGASTYNARFDSWKSKAFDRYDWDPKKHLTVPNPDFRNPNQLPNPIAPNRDRITVFHTNAKRIERARLAAPYDVESTAWTPTDPAITRNATVDGNKSI